MSGVKSLGLNGIYAFSFSFLFRSLSFRFAFVRFRFDFSIKRSNSNWPGQVPGPIPGQLKSDFFCGIESPGNGQRIRYALEPIQKAPETI